MLSHKVQAAFAERNLSRRLDALNKSESHTIGLERRLAETSKRIGLWDRLWIFQDSDDQKEAGELEREVGTARRELKELRSSVRADIDAVAAEYPPVEIWQRIDTCEAIARRELQVEGGVLGKKAPKPKRLIAELEALAHRILEIWVPDFDANGLIAVLRDEVRARELALSNEDVTGLDERLGHAPITQDALVGLVAGELLQGGYFSAEEEIERLKELEQRHEEELAQARKAVTTWASLNVITDSEEEKAAAEAVRKRFDIQAKLAATEAENRLLLASFLDAFPPLRVHRRIGAVLGAIGSLHVEETRHVGADGKGEMRKVVAPRALVLHTIAALRRAFLGAFPGLPMPSLVARDIDFGGGGVIGSPRNEILRDFTRAMDRREGDVALQQCANHAAMLRGITRTQSRLANEISWLDRAIFWDDSQEQAQTRLVTRRRKFHKDALAQGWGELVEIAATASREQPPLYVRDLSVNCSLHISAIGTTGNCSVNHHRGEAMELVDTIRRVLGDAYGLKGDRSSFMHHVATSLASPPLKTYEPAVFRARPFHDVVELVAQPLRGSSFLVDYNAFSEVSHAWNAKNQEKAAIKEKISFWDWVNFFSDTPAEERHKEIKHELKQMSTDFQARSSAVNAQFDRALDYYPPARLYYRTHAVGEALSRIYSRWVTRTHTDSKGRTRTTRTCELYGKAAAVKAMQQWNSDLVRSFGTLPDVHDCLERWVSHGGLNT
jgi:hypothetical protein